MDVFIFLPKKDTALLLKLLLTEQKLAEYIRKGFKFFLCACLEFRFVPKRLREKILILIGCSRTDVIKREPRNGLVAIGLLHKKRDTI